MNDRSSLPATSGEGRAELRFVLPDTIADASVTTNFGQRLGMAFRQNRGRRFGDSQVRIENCTLHPHGKVARCKVAMSS